jgi:hypothetical protein
MHVGFHTLPMARPLAASPSGHLIGIIRQAIVAQSCFLDGERQQRR